MIITNKYNVPEALFKAAATDTYSRGKSRISVTQLISAPRISILKNKHHHEMTSDAVDQIWSLLGTAVHKILETNASEHHQSEERLFIDVNGWTISGAVDVQDNNEGIIDYKVTGVWSVLNDKPEWEAQLNCYAALVRRAKGITIKRLQICAILRDWHRSGTFESNYPPQPIQMVEIPVWSAEKQDAYLEERVAIHQHAATSHDWGEELPECTDDDRWVRKSTWAVLKKGRVRALKVFDNPEDAASLAANDPTTSVEARPGKAVRCEENYCGVNQWCSQWKRNQERI